MEKFDENAYKREADRIHAPKDLMERTRAAMLAEEARLAEEAEAAEETGLSEERKRTEEVKTAGPGYQAARQTTKKIYRWRRYAAAACIGLLALGGYGGYRYRADNYVHIQELADLEYEDSEWNIGMSLGQAGKKAEQDNKGTDNGEKVQVVSGKDESAAPKELWEKEKSRIKGVDIYIGFAEEENTYYAAWEYDGIYYCASARAIEEKEFLNYLKKNIKNQ